LPEVASFEEALQENFNLLIPSDLTRQLSLDSFRKKYFTSLYKHFAWMYLTMTELIPRKLRGFSRHKSMGFHKVGRSLSEGIPNYSTGKTLRPSISYKTGKLQRNST